MDYCDIDIILLEIKNELEKYFFNSSCYKNIYVGDVNKEFIEIKNRANRVIVKIPFDKLFLYSYTKNVNELDCYIKVLNRIKHKSDDLFIQLSYNYDYIDKKNKRLETWYNKLSSYEDRAIIGFYNDRGRIAEFLMEETRQMASDDTKRKFMLEFSIGNASVKISEPSSIFKLIFKKYISCDYDGWWEYFNTINIEGVSRNKLNKHLQQSLFINNIYNSSKGKSILKFGVESQLRTYPNNYDYNGLNINSVFPESNYEKPLAFYNEAFNGTDETAFLYYYKVLEVFFCISKGKSELICLEKLLMKLNFGNDVTDVIGCEFKSYMLEKDDINNIDCENVSIKIFAEKLYKYRNSVAHGKDDINLLSHIPMNLIEQDDAKKMRGWNEITKKLAYICIKYFCFDNFELLSYIDG